MPIKCLIVPPCNDVNRGDQALLWGSATFLHDALSEYAKKIDCRVLSRGDSTEEQEESTAQTTLKGFKALPTILGHPRRNRKKNVHSIHDHGWNLFKMTFTGCKDFIVLGFLWIFPGLVNIVIRVREKRETFEFLKQVDYLVFKGGGSIHAYGNWKDFYYIWFQTIYVLLAHRLGIKVIILPNSFGPIEGFFVRHYVKWLLKGCKIVYTREHISKEFLEESLSLENVHYMPDLAYFMDMPQNNTEYLQGNRSVGITVRPYRFPGSSDPDKKYEKYIHTFAKFCEYLRDQGYTPYFVVHVKGPGAHEDDRIAIQDVLQHMSFTSEVIDVSGNCYELAKTYQSFSFLVGTRFHSVIFSHISEVPSIAIAYGGNKSRGIMRDIGLENYVIDIEEINLDLLIKKFEELISGSSRYKELVRHSIQNFYELRKKELERIRNV